MSPQSVKGLPKEKRFYVNSWGRAKKEIVMDRVGAKAPARFLCITEQYSFPEIIEIRHAKADSFQDFSFIITAFNITVRPRNIHGVQYLLKPISVCSDTIIKLRHLHHFDR